MHMPAEGAKGVEPLERRYVLAQALLAAAIAAADDDDTAVGPSSAASSAARAGSRHGRSATPRAHSVRADGGGHGLRQASSDDDGDDREEIIPKNDISEFRTPSLKAPLRR